MYTAEAVEVYQNEERFGTQFPAVSKRLGVVRFGAEICKEKLLAAGFNAAALRFDSYEDRVNLLEDLGAFQF